MPTLSVFDRRHAQHTKHARDGNGDEQRNDDRSSFIGPVIYEIGDGFIDELLMCPIILPHSSNDTHTSG
jgi:hypothetical protein